MSNTDETETKVSKGGPGARQLQNSDQAREVLTQLGNHAEKIKKEEVQTALDRLLSHRKISSKEEAVIETLATALLGSLLQPPCNAILRAAQRDDEETLAEVHHLFTRRIETEQSDDEQTATPPTKPATDSATQGSRVFDD